MFRLDGAATGRRAFSAGVATAVAIALPAGLGAQQVSSQGPAVVTATRISDSMIVVRKRVDSLLQLFNNTSMSSPQFARIQDQIGEAVRAFNHVNNGASIGFSPDFIVAYRRDTSDARQMIVKALPRGWVGFTADGILKERLTEEGKFIQYLVTPTVVAVAPGSPASRAGIAKGDRVVAFNDRVLIDSMVNVTQMETPGQTLKVQIIRDGAPRVVGVLIEPAPPDQAEQSIDDMMAQIADFANHAAVIRVDSVRRGAGGVSAGVRSFAVTMPPGSDVAMAGMLMPSRIAGVYGAAVQNLDPDMAKLTHTSFGVFVSKVDSSTQAHRMGLRSGDVIVRVGKQDVHGLAELYGMLPAQPTDKPAEISVIRDGKTVKITLADPKVH